MTKKFITYDDVAHDLPAVVNDLLDSRYVDTGTLDSSVIAQHVIDNATYGRRNYGTWDLWAMGDSITDNGNGVPVEVGNRITGAVVYGSRSYLGWALPRSAGRFRFGGVAATAGYTSTQILATHTPTVVAAAPAMCVILAGTNDLGGPLATTTANITAMVAALEAVGTIPILATLPPQNGYSGGTAITSRNSWIIAFAASKGLPCVDFYTALANPSTHNYVTAYDSGDHIHPSDAGAAAMGVALGAVLAGITAAPSILKLLSNPAPAALITDPGFNDPAGAWAFGAGYGTSVPAKTTGAGWDGYKFTLTRGDTDITLLYNFTVVPGHRVLFAAKIESTHVGAGGNWGFYIGNPTTGQILVGHLNVTQTLPLGISIFEFTVPAGMTTARVAMWAQAAATTEMGAAQVTVLDLGSSEVVVWAAVEHALAEAIASARTAALIATQHTADDAKYVASAAALVTATSSTAPLGANLATGSWSFTGSCAASGSGGAFTGAGSMTMPVTLPGAGRYIVNYTQTGTGGNITVTCGAGTCGPYPSSISASAVVTTAAGGAATLSIAADAGSVTITAVTFKLITAVSPLALTATAPDGGRLEVRTNINYSTSIGVNAGASLTTAPNATNIGNGAGQLLTTGPNNTNIGMGAGQLMTIAYNNTNIGVSAGAAMVSAANATNVGYAAGHALTTAPNNTNIGYAAGYAITTAPNATNVGVQAGYALTTGSNATNIGHAAGPAMTTASNCTNVGVYAGLALTTAPSATNVGSQAGRAMTTAANATNIGASAGYSLTTAANPTNIGFQAGYSMTTSANSTNVGVNAGYALTTGGGATNIGAQSGFAMTTGVNATNIGCTAGYTMTTAANATNVGSGAGFSMTTADSATNIGVNAGYSISTGAGAVNVGANAGYSMTTATGVTNVGYNAGHALTTADNATNIGTNAGLSMTTAVFTTNVGNAAGHLLTTGASNTNIGYCAGYTMTTAANCTNVGASAGGSITTASNATNIGMYAGLAMTTASSATNIGVTAGQALTTGANATNVGVQAGYSMTTGANVTNIGTNAGYALTTANSATNVGYGAGHAMTTAVASTNIGALAGYWITTGANATTLGYSAAYAPAGINTNYTVAGANVTAIGCQSGAYNNADPSDLTALGYNAVGGSQSTALGSGATASHTGSVALGYGTVTTAAAQVMVGARDVEITDTAKGVVIKSPDGTRYRIQVANGGALSAVAA